MVEFDENRLKNMSTSEVANTYFALRDEIYLEVYNKMKNYALMGMASLALSIIVYALFYFRPEFMRTVPLVLTIIWSLLSIVLVYKGYSGMMEANDIFEFEAFKNGNL